MVSSFKIPLFAVVAASVATICEAQNVTAATCVVNQETSETPFCTLPKRYCGLTGAEQLEKTEEAFQQYQKIFEDVCKTYTKEEACPNDPDAAPECTIPTKEQFCNSTVSPVVECTTDADCEVLPCYELCSKCQKKEVCDARVQLGQIAAEGTDPCRGGAGVIAASALAGLVTILSVVIML